VNAACGPCLRRSHLLGFLAPYVAGRIADRAAGLLSLPERELIAAIAGRRRAAAERFLDDFDTDEANAALERQALTAVCRHAREYPRPLLDLSDPPTALYATCPPDRLVELLAEPAVAVVGARRASPYAREVARELGRGLAAGGVTVVSGLALGVDAAAHEGAVAARAVGGPRGSPLAVLAGGVDVPYPRRHRSLYRRVRRLGAVIAELPPGSASHRWAFPARNRIMAGLARMTVVVEAAERSGSLITAAFALDLGRDVGAVPGRVTARSAGGTNALLRDGALVVRRTEDVLDALFGVGGHPSGARAAPAAGGAPLDPALRRVLDAIEAGEPVSLGVPGLSGAEVRAALGRLEGLGLVRRRSLGSYERVARDPPT
jgi:DNA processing protein